MSKCYVISKVRWVSDTAKRAKQIVLQRENERVFVVRDVNSDAFKNQTEMSIIKWNSNVKCGRAR